MFGYLTADQALLSDAAAARYKGCYCGLCRSLQLSHGLSGRMTLTYDMTFLILVLSSLYEPEEQTGSARCPIHPVHQHPWWTTEYTRYASDFNVLLAWWNCLDDWEDERNLAMWSAGKLLSGRADAIAQRYPRQSGVIARELQRLKQYESGEQVNADLAAECFGRLMGELFVVNPEDYWAPTLYAMGQGLGRFIYILDACLDREADRRKGCPNPMLTPGSHDLSDDRDILSMLLADAVQAFEHLPMVQDMELMRNILYSGVWQKYNLALQKQQRRTENRGEKKAHDGSL